MSVTDMLRWKVKQNHVKCSLKPEKAESRKGKETVNKCNEQKTVGDVVDVNCINKHLTFYK